jgi:hypothetical protein
LMRAVIKSTKSISSFWQQQPSRSGSSCVATLCKPTATAWPRYSYSVSSGLLKHWWKLFVASTNPADSVFYSVQNGSGIHPVPYPSGIQSFLFAYPQI